VSEVPDRHHDCGCVTRFDLINWHSVTVRECDEHRAKRLFHFGGPTDA
jgi:hypothetical protein